MFFSGFDKKFGVAASTPFAFSELGEGAQRADEVVLTVCRCIKAVQKPTTTSSPAAAGASPGLEKPEKVGFSAMTKPESAAFYINPYCKNLQNIVDKAPK